MFGMSLSNTYASHIHSLFIIHTHFIFLFPFYRMITIASENVARLVHSMWKEYFDLKSTLEIIHILAERRTVKIYICHKNWSISTVLTANRLMATHSHILLFLLSLFVFFFRLAIAIAIVAVVVIAVVFVVVVDP